MLALALLASLCFAAYQLVAAPVLRAYSDVEGRIEDSQIMLRRYRALSAQALQLSARLQAVKDAVGHGITYLKGTSHTLAGADLQNHARSIVEIAGGELRSSQILPVESSQKEGAIRRVSLRLQVWVGMGHLQDLLYGFETAQPSVFIEEITIRQARPGESDDDRATNPMLEIMVEVYGFITGDSTRPLANSNPNRDVSLD
jgi:hypothetical protein